MVIAIFSLNIEWMLIYAFTRLDIAIHYDDDLTNLVLYLAIKSIITMH